MNSFTITGKKVFAIDTINPNHSNYATLVIEDKKNFSDQKLATLTLESDIGGFTSCLVMEKEELKKIGEFFIEQSEYM